MVAGSEIKVKEIIRGIRFAYQLCAFQLRSLQNLIVVNLALEIYFL